MNKKITIIFTVIFTLSILASVVFGKTIRDALSPQVVVMSPVFYTFSDGSVTVTGLSSQCFHSTSTPDNGDAGDIQTFALIVEKRNDTGEEAYFAKKIDVIKGKSDGICTELLKSSQMNAMYICSADKTLEDGDRVVIFKIINTP
ncbi:MAG: hypothetical protein J6I50_01035 [Clostridia bacterium]|nr:hypothetical protein [Clostridia bacterium]